MPGIPRLSPSRCIRRVVELAVDIVPQLLQGASPCGRSVGVEQDRVVEEDVVDADDAVVRRAVVGIGRPAWSLADREVGVVVTGAVEMIQSMKPALMSGTRQDFPYPAGARARRLRLMPTAGRLCQHLAGEKLQSSRNCCC